MTWKTKALKYGDKRDYPKINIFVGGQYVCSTTWAKTCKEAIERYKEKPYRPNLDGAVTAYFDKDDR